jgi:hypothetical protein
MVEADQFTKALRDARLAEAAQFDAMVNLQDARILRLQNLSEAVKAKLAGHEAADALFELNVQAGGQPRLWIDLVSGVEMEPNPRHYQLVQHRENSRHVVFESDDFSAMVDHVVQYVAHRMVTREKAALGLGVATAPPKVGYTVRDMIYIWLTGCIFGVMAMLSVAIYLKKISF